MQFLVPCAGGLHPHLACVPGAPCTHLRGSLFCALHSHPTDMLLHHEIDTQDMHKIEIQHEHSQLANQNWELLHDVLVQLC